MPNGIREALIIINPKAGRVGGAHDRRLERARAILASGGIETEVACTDAPGAAQAFAEKAGATRRQMVIVCGGDGTLNEVVNGLAGSKVPVALLPAGTANVLAKELGLPWNIEKAAGLIAQSQLRRIALGQVTTEDGRDRPRYFLSIGGAGPDAAIVNGVNSKLKERAGTLAYWAEGFRQLARYNFTPFRAIVGERVVDATLMVIGRTKHYGGPFRITTAADLFGDDFELMVCTARSPLTYLCYLPLVWAGELRRARHAHFFRSTVVRCEPLGGVPTYAQVDGEPAGRLPAEFRIVPDALTLAVPAAQIKGA